MAEETKHLIDEVDVGSGEKNAGQKETEKQVEQIAGRHPPHQDDALNKGQAQQPIIKGNTDASEALNKKEDQQPDTKQTPRRGQ